ncbi:MAG: YdcF family protein [Pseudomonadota bacterium]
MELGSLKPLLTAIAMPPLSLLLLALLGLLLLRQRKRTGVALITVALALLWILSCHGTAVWLARNALPQYPPPSVVQLKATGAQAIVVLGGGMQPVVPEYGEAQPGSYTLARLRYGIWLAKQTGLPFAVTGGIGWGSAGADEKTSEAQVSARVAQQEYGVTPRWLESQSRDTSQNALMLAPLLKRDGIRRIVLVTDAWHMPRAMRAFERTGLLVSAAPIGYVLPAKNDIVEWLPSGDGLAVTQQLLKEWLGLLAGRWLAI